MNDQTIAAAVTASAAYLPKELSFFFRTKQVTNELGEKVDVKRPTVKLNVPVITLTVWLSCSTLATLPSSLVCSQCWRT